MADISQIEINGTVFNIEDAEIKDKVDQFTDYYNYDKIWYNPFTDLNHKHAHAAVGDSVQLCAMDEENSTIGRSLNIWGDTGNFRNDKLDFSTGTTTTLGYVPLSKYTTRKSYESSTSSSLFTPASGYKVDYLRLQRWGQVVQFSLRLTHTNAISVPANGNISNLTLGTLNSANWRPTQTAYLHSYGDNAGQLWGYLTKEGTVVLTAAEGYGTTTRSISASLSIDLNSVYITPMTNNY